MAGPRFLRQRRASLRPFEAVEIAEVLEARRLLAAVAEEGLIEAPQPEGAVAENLVVAAEEYEEYTEECLLGEYPEIAVEVVEVAVDEELPGEPTFADPLTEEVVPDKEDAGVEEFRPILVVCEFPEELRARCPDAGERDWSTDFSTVRGFEDQTEYVPLDLPGNFAFTDTTLIENEVSDDGTWNDFVDVGSDVTGDISADDTTGMESVFSSRDPGMGQSGDRAADSRLVSVRTESRTATPGPHTSVVPKRSTLLKGLLSDSTTPKDAAAVEGREQLDIFGDGRAAENNKAARTRQSPSESRVDAPVRQSSEVTYSGVSRTTPEYVDSGETVSVSVDPETAGVSGLATGKQALR